MGRIITLIVLICLSTASWAWDKMDDGTYTCIETDWLLVDPFDVDVLQPNESPFALVVSKNKLKHSLYKDEVFERADLEDGRYLYTLLGNGSRLDVFFWVGKDKIEKVLQSYSFGLGYSRTKAKCAPF